MKATEAEQLRDPAAAAAFAAAAVDAPAPHQHHHGPLSSVREDTHHGRRIEIVTTYEIRVDGVPVTTHLSVSKDGKLHCHALPNYVFSSAVNLVRRLIDLYPYQFPQTGGHGHGGHSHEHS